MFNIRSMEIEFCFDHAFNLHRPFGTKLELFSVLLKAFEDWISTLKTSFISEGCRGR